MTDKIELPDLLPCPFCGGEARAATCPISDIHHAGCADEDCIGHMDAYDFTSKETAIAAWNKRADTSAIAADRAKRAQGGDTEGFVVGRLPTVNQDEYPALGSWWVQIWHGEKVFARAYGDNPQEAHANAQRIADGLANAPQVPDGFVLVPKEPTEQMVNAMKDAWWKGSSAHLMKTTDAYRVYFSMLSAAPQPCLQTHLEQKGQHERG